MFNERGVCIDVVSGYPPVPFRNLHNMLIQLIVFTHAWPVKDSCSEWIFLVIFFISSVTSAALVIFEDLDGYWMGVGG